MDFRPEINGLIRALLKEIGTSIEQILIVDEHGDKGLVDLGIGDIFAGSDSEHVVKKMILGPLYTWYISIDAGTEEVARVGLSRHLGNWTPTVYLKSGYVQPMKNDPDGDTLTYGELREISNRFQHGFSSSSDVHTSDNED